MIGFISTWLQVLLITFEYSAIFAFHNLQFTVRDALGFSAFTSRLLVTELKVSLWLNLPVTHQVFRGRLLILLLRRAFRGYLQAKTQNWLGAPFVFTITPLPESTKNTISHCCRCMFTASLFVNRLPKAPCAHPGWPHRIQSFSSIVGRIHV
jgi:hypothetical protein